MASGLTAAYVAFALWASSPWRAELRDAIGPVMSWVIPVFLAYVPAVLIGFMISTLITLRYRVPPSDPLSGPWPEGAWPPVTVVIAARNEESAIGPTLERIADLSYEGPLTAILADNNSTDRTVEVAEDTARRRGLKLRRSFEPEAGKWRALNRALESVETPIVVTVDADTLLHPEALTYLVGRLMRESGGQHVCACAGALVVEGPTRNLLTRMQSWDYRLGINGIKRMQSAYHSTLVAQGAFSAYWIEDVRAVGGWPDAIGEDIVLTWSMMASRGLVEYEPCALAATAAPERVSALMRQRSRWAEGMLEGLQRNPPGQQPRVLARFVCGLDYLVPLLDIGYVFFWVPGVILFIAGYPLLFSWWSMLVLPITLVIYGLLRRWQERHVFDRLGFHPRHDALGFFGYLFGYRALVSPAALRGYGEYLAGAPRRWK
ncbi:MAG TPA: glycosyltransferase family 2 protein [Solirubrobacterales bacterium]|nr:glycosyltransferase family 2 protein [Solirubrobacterales bacterium]